MCIRDRSGTVPHSSRPRLPTDDALLQKGDALHACNLKALAAAQVLAHHYVVAPQHVRLRLGELRPLSLIHICLLAVYSILPDQLLQRESVAAKLVFGLPGSVVLTRASLLLNAAGGIRIPSPSMTVPLRQVSEAKSVPRKYDIA